MRLYKYSEMKMKNPNCNKNKYFTIKKAHTHIQHPHWLCYVGEFTLYTYKLINIYINAYIYVCNL